MYPGLLVQLLDGQTSHRRVRLGGVADINASINSEMVYSSFICEYLFLYINLNSYCD